MRVQDSMSAKGMVVPYFINLKTGERQNWENRHNTISYEASFAMASAFGGDLTYIPNRIGIIYGAGSNFGSIGRDQTWADLADELSTQNADVQVVPFSYTPTLKTVIKGEDPTSSSSSASFSTSSSSSGDDTYVTGHAVTFHAHSDSVTSGAFGTYHEESSGSSSSSGSIFTSGTYIYQAVLLNKTTNAYRIIARVSLDHNGTYYMKPENFEVALDWTIKFF